MQRYKYFSIFKQNYGKKKFEGYEIIKKIFMLISRK